MVTGVAMRLHQERRRLAFVVFMAFFAGYFMYLRADLYFGICHVALVTGAIYAAVVGFCALVVLLLLPSMRFMVEAVAIARLALSLTVFAVPGLAPLLLSNPFLTASLIVAGGLAVRRLLHGRVLSADRATLWPRLFPEGGFQRLPLRVEARPWQQSYLGWIEGRA